MADKKLALITGASSGIGADLAREHARRGGDLILVARRAEKLEALKAALEADHGVTVHVMARDLAVANAGEDLHAAVREAGLEVDYLINNAGFGGHGAFHERPWTEDKAMVQLNIETLTALTRAFLPGMVERGRGRVLNVASTAAFLPGPLMAVYYATKAYVLSLSEALASELRGTGVTVTALCPGVTRTEFGARANVGDSKLFRGPWVAGSAAVAAFGYRAMLAGRVVAVHGFWNKVAAHVALPLLPKPVVRRVSLLLTEKVKKRS
ncbi:MAG: SDR family oxidoreductase [Sumerlaeia bacterium]